jgi:NADH:ubiquinone oxidoreductase subunit H
MIAGWSSNSGYSLLRGLRALAQSISYEVRSGFILLSFVILVCRYNLAYFYYFQVYLWLTFLSVPLCCGCVAGCIREGQFDSCKA